MSEIVNTPQFKTWFGNSKIVDSTGHPRVVYHGTNRVFTSFDKKISGGINHRLPHIWFTSDKDIANLYAMDRAEDGSPNIIPLYVSIKNPIEWEKYLSTADDQIRKMGYDGIIHTNDKGDISGAAFSPNQLKSVISNKTFDFKDDDILKEGARINYLNKEIDKLEAIQKNIIKSTRDINKEAMLYGISKKLEKLKNELSNWEGLYAAAENPDIINENLNYIGNVDYAGSVNGVQLYDPKTQIHHLSAKGNGDRWRYDSSANTVVWTTQPSKESMISVNNWLAKKRIFPNRHIPPDRHMALTAAYLKREGIETPPAIHQSTNEISKDFINYIKHVENGIKKGFKNGVWYIYKDPTGPHIGYGHKVEKGEDRLFINGIDDDQAEKLLQRDLLLAKRRVYLEIKSMFNVSIPLDKHQEEMFMDFEYNLGTIRKFPKFVRAVLDKNWNVVKQEYKRVYTDKSGVPIEITGRNKAFYDKFLSNTNITQQIKENEGDDIIVGCFDEDGNVLAEKGGNHEKHFGNRGFSNWRYNPHTKLVYWHGDWSEHTKHEEDMVTEYLENEDYGIRGHVLLLSYSSADEKNWNHAHGRYYENIMKESYHNLKLIVGFIDDEGHVYAFEDNGQEINHEQLKKILPVGHYKKWRYNSIERTVFWHEEPIPQEKDIVQSELKNEFNLDVDIQKMIKYPGETNSKAYRSRWNLAHGKMPKNRIDEKEMVVEAYDLSPELAKEAENITKAAIGWVYAPLFRAGFLKIDKKEKLHNSVMENLRKFPIVVKKFHEKAKKGSKKSFSITILDYFAWEDVLKNKHILKVELEKTSNGTTVVRTSPKFSELENHFWEYSNWVDAEKDDPVIFYKKIIDNFENAWKESKQYKDDYIFGFIHAFSTCEQYKSLHKPIFIIENPLSPTTVKRNIGGHPYVIVFSAKNENSEFLYYFNVEKDQESLKKKNIKYPDHESGDPGNPYVYMTLLTQQIADYKGLDNHSVERIINTAKHEAIHVRQDTRKSGIRTGLPKQSLLYKYNLNVRGKNHQGMTTTNNIYKDPEDDAGRVLHHNRDVEFKSNLYSMVEDFKHILGENFPAEKWKIGFRLLIEHATGRRDWETMQNIKKQFRTFFSWDMSTTRKALESLYKNDPDKFRQYVKEIYKLLFVSPEKHV